jgi:ferric-dicitrate binding protein FerR (iron transport regulator)
MLSPGSVLRYSQNFPRERRNVALSGEAYFEVVHDERHPFTVRAGDLVATDLGTEFVVRAYPEDAHSKVVVRQGLVGIQGKKESRHIAPVRPGQFGYLAADGRPVVQPADTATAFAWTNGWLIFDRMALADALPQLGRWYDLEFRLADSSLAKIPLSGTFKEELTDSRLKLLAASVGTQYVRQGRVVMLYR